MLPKPASCQGCPMYGDGMGFVPDSIPEKPVVMFLGQNPGGDEEAGRKVTGYNEQGRAMYEPHPPAPFLGKTGYLWETKLLPRAGLQRDEVAICNVLRCRQQVNGVRSNDLPSGKTLKEAVKHCSRAYFRVPDSIQLIVAGGDLAWNLLTTVGPVTDWRGYVAPAGVQVDEEGKLCLAAKA